MESGGLEEMDTAETIETEVIASNNMLTLITTEDGIPTSTEVTVLTTTLGDVPIMAATLGTLSEVPHVTSHPTFVTSHAGVRTVYATSLIPSHAGQAVVLSNGQIAVMGPDGVRRALVVHADQISGGVGVASQSQNVVTVNLQEATSDFPHNATVVLTEQEASSLSHETQVLSSIQEVSAEVIDANVSSLVQEGIIIQAHEVENISSSSPLQTEELIQTEQQEKVGNVVLEEIENKSENDKLTEKENSNDVLKSATEAITPIQPPPSVPNEIVCLVCYQAFLNPKASKKEFENQGSSDIGKNTISTKPIQDQNESDCYGRTLGRFFEISRINMSIVTRRSYKDYEVPLCQTCVNKLCQTEKILEELKQLEKRLYFLRQEIKEEIVASHSFYRRKENKELAEGRRKMPGLAEILDIVDRIREDIINDGRPPRIPRSMTGGKKPGRKPKKLTSEVGAGAETQPLPTEEKEKQAPSKVQEESKVDNEASKAEIIVPDNISEVPGDPNTISQPTKATSSQVTETNAELTKSTESQIKADEGDEEKEEKPAIRTSFGRLVKRPAYMINELTEDELSELGESSEDNYEEIVVKPEILTEGEPGVLNEDEVDEEDPAWSPGRGMFISEKVGIPASSSEESEYVSDDSDIDGVSNTKIKKEPKVRKPKKARARNRPAAKKQKIKRVMTRPENMNYEVKVIQLDGTELMTINTTGEEDGIGLEPEITQKVMDSQAVIMVKNQLFGKRVQCPHCTRTFTDPARRDVHVKKKHEGLTKPFECEVCRKRFGRQDHLRNHMKRHTRPPKEKSSKPKTLSTEKTQCCEFCNQRFRNKSELQIHTRLHTGERPFKCEHCTEAFVSALKKEFHIEQMHPEVPPLRCEHCPKSFFRQHRLRIHAVSHTGEKTNICEICGKSFSQAAMLRYHQTTHEELNLKQFKCQECNRVFANPQNLKSHMESQHQKMYRHRCQTCGRGYTQMSHLRRHLRTHSGEQPYGCTYCPKKFTSGAALKIHVRIHTGERPYWCSQCEKGFRSKTKLGRHLKTLIHSGEKDKMKKDTSALTTEIETVDVNAASSTTWTEIVGIITGV